MARRRRRNATAAPGGARNNARKGPVSLVAAVGTTAGLAACGAGSTGLEVRSDVDHEVVTVEATAAVPDAVNATTALGATLVAAGDATENRVVSPASVAVALAMLAEGARGQSATVLDGVLGAAGEERTDAYNALQAAVLEYDGDPGSVDGDDLPERPLLHLANAVVVDEDRDVEREYLDRLARGYGAGLRVADLSDASGKRVLDAWVREHTGGRIRSSAIQPDPNLVLVLQNAVLLAARWQDPFAAEVTSDLPFTLVSGQEVPVPTMTQRLLAAYAELRGAQAVRLPYTEGFAMDVVLPPEGAGPSLSAEDWYQLGEALSGPVATDVLLHLPTVDVKTSADLVPPLRDLGLGVLFSYPEADLTGIAPDLFVGAVAHQATLTVDEEGTVAAATTEVGVTAGSAPDPAEPVVMTVDRPFAVRIVHLETGWPMFMGAIADPRG
ncbi:serpin family protein [Georgenia daeguensis]|uniref:Serpin family protein n=1 Tax=Georgenia daeguensis TaxID=908355 RepID=A0ABP8EPY4_9MICO